MKAKAAFWQLKQHHIVNSDDAWDSLDNKNNINKTAFKDVFRKRCALCYKSEKHKSDVFCGGCKRFIENCDAKIRAALVYIKKNEPGYIDFDADVRHQVRKWLQDKENTKKLTIEEL